MAYCRENGRVCPMPQQWVALFDVLSNKRQVGVAREPALPLILAAWHEASALAKMLRLAEHIEWAAKQGDLLKVAEYLHALPESSWFHLGE